MALFTVDWWGYLWANLEKVGLLFTPKSGHTAHGGKIIIRNSVMEVCWFEICLSRTINMCVNIYKFVNDVQTAQKLPFGNSTGDLGDLRRLLVVLLEHDDVRFDVGIDNFVYTQPLTGRVSQTFIWNWMSRLGRVSWKTFRSRDRFSSPIFCFRGRGRWREARFAFESLLRWSDGLLASLVYLVVVLSGQLFVGLLGRRHWRDFVGLIGVLQWQVSSIGV